MRRNKFAFEEAEVIEQPEQAQQAEEVVNTPAEQPTEEVVEEAPIVMQDLSEDILCIDEDQEEIGDYVDSIEDTSCDAEELQGYSDIMEKNLDNGMSPDAVEAIQLATESICKRLGIVKKNTKISLEAFEELKNNKESTRLAFEENNGVVVRTLKAIWVAIKKAFIKIKEFIKNLFGFNKKVEQKLKETKQKTEEHVKKKHEIKPIVEPHVTAAASTKVDSAEGELKGVEKPINVGDVSQKDTSPGEHKSTNYDKLHDFKSIVGQKKDEEISGSEAISRIQKTISVYFENIEALSDIAFESKRNMVMFDDYISRIKPDEQYSDSKMNASHFASKKVELNKHIFLTNLKSIQYVQNTYNIFTDITAKVDRGFSQPSFSCDVKILTPEENKHLNDFLTKAIETHAKRLSIAEAINKEINGVTEELEQKINKSDSLKDKVTSSVGNNARGVLNLIESVDVLLVDVLKVIFNANKYCEESAKYYA